MWAMRAARLLTIVALLLATPVASAAFAKGPSTPAGPSGLQGFLLRPNESVTHTFARTPSFAWRPVRGASCYEFELATSRTFDGSAVVWSNAAEGTKAGKRCGSVKTFISSATTETSRARSAETKTQTGTISRDSHPGCLGEPDPALVHGQALRALRPRPRHHAARADEVEQGVRLQHALGGHARPDVPAARPRALAARRRRDLVPGLVPGHPQVVLDAHERRRPARVLPLPRRPELVLDGALARPRGAARARSEPERPARGVLRPLEPRLLDDEPLPQLRQARSPCQRLRRREHGLEERRAPADAGAARSPATRTCMGRSGRSSASMRSRIATASTSSSAAPSSAAQHSLRGRVGP